MGRSRTIAIVGLAARRRGRLRRSYAPETVDRLSPALGQAAHRYHDELWGGQKQTRPRSAGDLRAPGGVAPIVVTVVSREARGLPDRAGESRTGPGLQHRARAGARRRRDRQDRLQGRTDRQAGRPSRPDRPPAVPGGARSGRREEGAGRGDPRQRQARPRALRDARQAGLRDPAATRHAERARQPADGDDRRRRRGDRRGAGCSSTTRRSARRSPAAPASA